MEAITTTRAPLASGNAGVQQAIVRMQQLARGKMPDGRDEYPAVRKLALDIVRGTNDREQQAQRVFAWVKQNIQFIGELDETVQSPMTTVHLGAGDCDDHSTLIAALLNAIGFDTRFKTVAADPEAPEQYTHVYVEANIPARGWTALDSTVKHSTLGWQPRHITRARAWNASGRAAQNGSTMTGYYSAALRRKQRNRGTLSGMLDGAATSRGDGLGIASGDPLLVDVLNNIAAPIAQGVANRITYGNRTALATFGVTNPGSSTASAFPNWLILFGAAAVLLSIRR